MSLRRHCLDFRLIDDVGTQHIFILDSCLNHPDSPVNLLSTRQLAEKFLDANGNLDEETCIESRYSTHVLTWLFGQFKKMFPTPVSGLPELLFNKGFCAYKSFCMQAHSSYVNTVTNLTSETSKQPSNIIPVESQELSADSLDDTDGIAINMFFMPHENIILKDSKGITQEVMYLGPQYLDEILEHKVWNRNGHIFLVDGTLLSSLDVSDISNFPVSAEQYSNELQKLTQEQLQHISHPHILDNDQQEFMGLHYKINHLSLPGMITLAEKGKLNRKFAKVNTSFRFACLASLARLIANHGA